MKKTDTNSKAKEIYDCYVKWCADNGYGIENKGNFFAEMKNKGLFATSGTVTGKTVKNVIKGYVIDTDFQTVNDDSENTFFVSKCAKICNLHVKKQYSRKTIEKFNI